MLYKHIVLDEETHSFQEDWIDASNDLLKETFRVLIESEENALPDSLLTEWENLMTDYFGPIDHAAISVHSYLSQPKGLLMEIYGDSEVLRRYINRLFRIIKNYYLLSKRKQPV